MGQKGMTMIALVSEVEQNFDCTTCAWENIVYKVVPVFNTQSCLSKWWSKALSSGMANHGNRESVVQHSFGQSINFLNKHIYKKGVWVEIRRCYNPTFRHGVDWEPSWPPRLGRQAGVRSPRRVAVGTLVELLVGCLVGCARGLTNLVDNKT